MAEFRIFVDESGTHANDYLIIGMLFVPDHGSLHKKLVEVKDSHSYLNTKTGRKSSAKYKETHVAEFKRQVDVDVVSDWMDVFLTSDAWFRAIVIDWDIWDGKHFGGPFEPAALKKRRAYKKWAEMLLQPEFSRPLPGRLPIRDANLYLDRLVVTYGYEILDELKERFTSGYKGNRPFIKSFQHTASWKDANQGLQLCDVLVGALYQELVPSTNRFKLAVRDTVAEKLQAVGVERLAAGFWKQWHYTTIREHLPKYNAWFWQLTPFDLEEARKRPRTDRTRTAVPRSRSRRQCRPLVGANHRRTPTTLKTPGDTARGAHNACGLWG